MTGLVDHATPAHAIITGQALRPRAASPAKCAGLTRIDVAHNHPQPDSWRQRDSKCSGIGAHGNYMSDGPPRPGATPPDLRVRCRFRFLLCPVVCSTFRSLLVVDGATRCSMRLPVRVNALAGVNACDFGL
jgi:hypothetical protein